MIERMIAIKDFRNIGKNAYEKLELNYVQNPKDKMGGIVTLIGMNNSGKSNFLDAFTFLNSKKLLDSDIPSFVDLTEVASPTAILWIKDIDKKIEYQYKVKQDKSFIEKYVNGKIEAIQVPKFEIDLESKTSVNYFINAVLPHLNIANYGMNYNDATTAINKLLVYEFQKNELKILLEIFKRADFRQNARNYGVYNEDHFNRIQTLLEKASDAILPNHKELEFGAELMKDYDLPIFPKIIKYDDSKKMDLSSTISTVVNGKLQKPDFFKVLFKLFVNKKFEDLENVYAKFHNAKSAPKYLLNNFKESIKVELDDLSKSFNQVYGYFNEKHYEFNLDFEKDTVYFNLTENGYGVDLNAQSTGFKWFFNFFFNVFAGQTFNNGDIVILDEPATNLHVRGIIELRKQLKRFGHEHGITFIISTHSPFFIDVDHLDEIRIVYKDNHVSKIENKFTGIKEHKEDVMIPIYTSLTVDRHVVLNPDKLTIFVEGITDYNYLTAFRNLLEITDICFLPVQGVKNKGLMRELFKITKTPIILVDSDQQGKTFKSSVDVKTGVEVFELDEIQKDFINIEDLFSKSDRDRFCSKDYKLSSYFKNNIHHLSISDETIKNFKKLITYLQK